MVRRKKYLTLKVKNPMYDPSVWALKLARLVVVTMCSIMLFLLVIILSATVYIGLDWYMNSDPTNIFFIIATVIMFIIVFYYVNKCMED